METVHTATATAGHHDEPSFNRKAIWKTFWILLVITLVELGLAIWYYETDFIPKLFLNGVFIIMTLAKAFFIIAEFMHLRHELKNMIMTIAIPALLFVWFLMAFLWDGGSFKDLRNTYDPYHKQPKPAPTAPAGEHGAQKPGAVH
jgi:cytochrome c oxidase subunit IV